MTRSVIFAIVFAAAAILWVASGQLGEDRAAPAVQKPPADLTTLSKAPQVRVRASTAQPHAAIDLLRGRTEANRLVEIRSETDGRVVELAVEDGTRVSTGDIIAELSPGDRPRSEEQTSELQSLMRISYAVFCLKNKKNRRKEHTNKHSHTTLHLQK